ncbi:MAG: putative metallophosphoesterase YhaO [Tenericutes bacterium ADurb.Bin087]|nr:MAG: putative metallophosphoesterase YhaO [Tenericutes bacterium ADurb.Bin087]
MKIIHTADIHIDSKMNRYGGDKTERRKREIKSAFFRLIDYGVNHKINVILIAGDLFDAKELKLSTLREVLTKINSAPAIDFIYLTGNHDDPAVLNHEKLGPLPQNLKIVTSENNTFEYDNLCIKAFDNYHGDSYIKNLNFDPNKYNILMLHGTETEIPFNKLKGKNIDYLALGDIHIPDISAKALDARGIYGYSGVLEPRGFDELGERGFFVLEIEQNRLLKREFIKNNSRTYHVINVDISGLNNRLDIEIAINNATKNTKSDDIVRIMLTGKYDYELVKDKNALREYLESKFYYAELKDESKLDISTIDFENEVSLRGEFFRLVQSSNYTSEEKEKLLEFGLAALKGGKIEL